MIIDSEKLGNQPSNNYLPHKITDMRVGPRVTKKMTSPKSFLKEMGNPSRVFPALFLPMICFIVGQYSM